MTRWDRRLLVVVLATGLALLVGSGLSLAASGRAVAVVTSPGSSFELPLETDARVVVDGHEGRVVVVVKDGSIDVVESSCSEQRCVETPAVTDSGGAIVCVPNGVSVTVSRVGGVEVDDVVR